MTFILNLLHKDFSLLAADQQANSEGPTIIRMEGLTINAMKGATIEGFRKIRISAGKSLAFASAGNVADHGFSDLLEKEENPEEGLRIIRNHMEGFYDFKERKQFLDGKPQIQNEVLLTFYDEVDGAFFSSLNLYTKFFNHTQFSARRLNGSPTLLHLGSGSPVFEKAMTEDSINEFIKQVADGLPLREQIAWFKVAFEKVSALATGCGVNFDMAIATREHPKFEWVGLDGVIRSTF